MRGLMIAAAAAVLTVTGGAAATLVTTALTVSPVHAASDAYCRAYARDAVRKNRTNLRRRCNFRGTRWQSNYANHYNWCRRTLRSRAIGEARARNAQLRNCRTTRVCPRIYRPVCAVLHGRRRTYGNSCVARNAGARIVAQGRCRTQTTYCPAIYRPVCGVKNGRRQTFSNLCVARRAGAGHIRNGQCRPQGGDRNKACAIQIKKKLGIIAGIRRKGCAMPRSADYSTNQQTQLRLCRGRTPRQRAGVLANMDAYRFKCRRQVDACALQIKRKLTIIAGIRRKGCAMPRSADYSTSQQTQLRLCRGRTPRQRAGVVANMDGYRFKCRPRGDGGAAKRRACNAYASRVMGQVAAWRGRGCPTGAPIWNPNRAVHYNLCMSGGQAAMSQQSRARANDLSRGCSGN